MSADVAKELQRLRGDLARAKEALARAEQDRDDWRTKSLDAERHPAVVALREERDAAVADNAALLTALLSSLEVPISHELRLYVRGKFLSEPRPGAALLEQHRRALAEARDEALEEAAAYLIEVFDQPTFAGEIRALKETKP